jgi:hypothetical protein
MGLHDGGRRSDDPISESPDPLGDWPGKVRPLYARRLQSLIGVSTPHRLNADPCNLSPE